MLFYHAMRGWHEQTIGRPRPASGRASGRKPLPLRGAGAASAGRPGGWRCTTRWSFNTAGRMPRATCWFVVGAATLRCTGQCSARRRRLGRCSLQKRAKRVRRYPRWSSHWGFAQLKAQNGLCNACLLPINPAHLAVGTHRQNMDDMASAGRSRALLTPMQKKEIVVRGQVAGWRYGTQAALAREYGVRARCYPRPEV